MIIKQTNLVNRNNVSSNRVFVNMFRETKNLFFFIPKEGEPRNGTLRKAGRAAPLLCDRSCPNVAKTGNETGDDSEILLEICCVQLYF